MNNFPRPRQVVVLRFRLRNPTDARESLREIGEEIERELGKVRQVEVVAVREGERLVPNEQFETKIIDGVKEILDTSELRAGIVAAESGAAFSPQGQIAKQQLAEAKAKSALIGSLKMIANASIGVVVKYLWDRVTGAAH